MTTPTKPETATTRTIEKAKKAPQNRAFSLQVEEKRELNYDVEARTVELAFSSETPYRRWYGDEILDHSQEAIDFTRLNSGGAVLMDHNWTDQIGVVESVRIDSDRVARAVIRFSRSARGEEVFNDVIDGIRTNISVGYFIREMVLERQDEDVETYRVTQWEPFEISLVAVPADPTVGIGRSAEPEASPAPPSEAAAKEDPAERLDNLSDALGIEADEATSLEDEVAVTPEQEGRVASEKSHQNEGTENMPNDKLTPEQAIEAERQRVADLTAIGSRFGAQDLAQKAIANGDTVDHLNAAILEARGFEATPAEGTTAIGLSDKEKRSYSFVKVLNALANPTDKKAQSGAAFELEVGAEAARKARKDTKGILVPAEILAFNRAHSAGSAADGGNLIATDLMTGSFIDLLQNRLAIMGAGATMLTGLEGNIAIPRQTGGAAAYWLAENGEPTESNAKFDQIGMTPKTVGAYTELSRKLLQQSSLGMEQFVQNELIRTLALAIDWAALNADGTNNMPLGLLNTSGIGSVAIAANGGAPLWKHVVDLETAIADENADVGSMKYLTNAKVRGKLKQTQVFEGTGERIWTADNSVNGYQTIVSNQVPKNGTKGSGTNLSSLVFGNFADLIIGMWGGLDLQVNPYSLDTKGAVRVTAFQDVDTTVRHPESFSALTDIVTD